MTAPSFWHYFDSPFPKAAGFSSYRMPGPLVHAPVIMVFVWLGGGLTFGDVLLWPLFVVYAAMGVYLGRDLAIMAHYNGLITLGIVGGFIALIGIAPIPPALSPLTCASITGVLVVLFALYVSWYVDVMSGHTPTRGRFPVIQRLIDRIDHAAAEPGDPEPVRMKKTLLIFMCTAGLVFAPWAARYCGQLGLRDSVEAVLWFAVVSLISLVTLVWRKEHIIPSFLQLSALLAAPAAIQWEIGSFAASGAIALWSLLAPLCALVFLGTRWAVPWFAAFVLLIIVLGMREVAAGADAQSAIFFCENILVVSCVAFIALRFFIVERDRAHAALAREQERSERLLLNILPAPIAERLKGEHRALADGYAEVSILFADIVGFTRMSASIAPERLVEILNRLFSRFDSLCDRFGVEKIKTIGDAYMACAGLPAPRADHAEAIADMALAMREALEEHNREFGTALKVRVGINTGPVVAGVIGLKKFIYDLWGDTVNFASRMESHGLPDSIQVSAATWTKLRSGYEFTPRGTIEVKGIGPVEAFLLTGKKVAPPPQAPS